ncbi:acid phosphatase/Vanadium-dependent haloperoxidase [Xylariaceae sp. FL0594]|nr:acid phosphatase/Vanadium-dependent haloperoxidase [Xylariaceae sp. FL0594]
MPDFSSLRMGSSRPKKIDLVVVLSYAFDWLIIVIVGVIGVILGNVTPNKRPFSLYDQNIAFPFTEQETVPSSLLLICNAVIPIGVILVIALVFVPGRTVPPGTPKSSIWKRKLWELHIGWLGLALSLITAWIITQGMKNLFGKPRPDLLSRCQADMANVGQYIVGYNFTAQYTGQLVSANICKNPDKALLDDGFRSYPSGHASSSAAGLIYLSFFIASKFAITFPFVPLETIAKNSGAVTAFPSRLNRPRHNTNSNSNDAATALSGSTAYESVRSASAAAATVDDETSLSLDPAAAKQVGAHNTAVAAIRSQAAAPPVYLLLLAVLPFFLAVFIASSRWFDFRHHGFDILFGFIIGTVAAYFSFRYYHMPIRAGGGWAWGPRSHDKAFWAGLGSWSYASDKEHWLSNNNNSSNNHNYDAYEAQRMRMQMRGPASSDDVELGQLRNNRGPSPLPSSSLKPDAIHLSSSSHQNHSHRVRGGGTDETLHEGEPI